MACLSQLCEVVYLRQTLSRGMQDIPQGFPRLQVFGTKAWESERYDLTEPEVRPADRKEWTGAPRDVDGRLGAFDETCFAEIQTPL